MKLDQYAVIGNPIKHSKSPDIHTLFAQQTRQNMQYTTLLAEIDAFVEVVQHFRQQGGLGLNVTVPFKRQAYELADELTARAQSAGAVNTLSFKNNRIYGDVTDGVGLMRDITVNHNIALAGQSILVLGAGGAVRGIMAPLLEQKPSNVVIANRTVSHAQALVERLPCAAVTVSACGFMAIPKGQFDLVINGTSMSLQGDVPPIDPWVVEQAICYDMMYGKQPTAFMQWAIKQGAQQAIDGLGMLVEQAAASFNIWRGVQPNSLAVIERLKVC